jgi:surface protein
MFAPIKFINMKKNYSQTFTKENSASSYASFFKSSILKCSKTMLAFLFTLFFAGNSFAQSNDFVTTWNLATPGSANSGGNAQLSFGVATSSTVSYSWTEVGGSGNGSSTFSGSTLTITGLPSGKTIELRISPTNFQRIIINNGTDKNRLLDVKQWGATDWTSMEKAFNGCINLNITATDVPDLSLVKSMFGTFTGCVKLNGPSNINSWNTIRVTNMYDLFNGCTIFNQNIGSWKTDSVTSMLQMFRGASAFNQNIGSWNTGRVGSFQQTFTNCKAFNQNISSWNTANAGEMNGMFQGATAFNQNIGSWNTAKVANMNNMFSGASAFNQNIGNWSLKSNVTMNNMLTNCGMDCNNYSATLIGWNSQSVTGRSLGATGREHANGLAARANLVKTVLNGGKGWTISGDAIGTCPDPTAPFITEWNLATPGSANSGGNAQLSFGVATSNIVNYDWTEVSPGTATGSGTFSGSTATITGLPTGKTIILRIFPTNFQRIIIDGGTDKDRLLDVEQWGATKWTSMNEAFKACINLNITATDVPNLSSVTDMYGMFTGCVKLNGPSNINSWNTIRVTNMYDLFNGCTIFNQNIGSWKTDSVTSMLQMFRGASAFNQNIGSWNTGRVGSFQQTFTNCTAFNQNISSWNTANAGEMNGMFQGATAFNQNIGSWNTAKVANMNNMFSGASAFNQNIGNWSLKSNVTMNNMLTNCGMDCNNYSATLIGWNSQSVTGRSLGATGREHANGLAARANLVKTVLNGGKGWTISGDAIGTCPDPAPSVQMIDFGGFIKHDVSNLDKPLNVYPNPATDFINLEFKGIAPSTFNVLVMDMSGKVIIKLDGVHAESNQYTLPLNGIVSGMYVVKLSDELGNTTINRFNIK